MPALSREKMLADVCQITWKEIRGTWGEGFKHLGDDTKKAIITERIFHVFISRPGNEAQTVKPEEMRENLNAMLNLCGLGPDEGRLDRE